MKLDRIVFSKNIYTYPRHDWVGTFDSAEGWLLEELAPGHVRFTRDGITFTHHGTPYTCTYAVSKKK